MNCATTDSSFILFPSFAFFLCRIVSPPLIPICSDKYAVTVRDAFNTLRDRYEVLHNLYNQQYLHAQALLKDYQIKLAAEVKKADRAIQNLKESKEREKGRSIPHKHCIIHMKMIYTIVTIFTHHYYHISPPFLPFLHLYTTSLFFLYRSSRTGEALERTRERDPSTTEKCWDPCYLA